MHPTDPLARARAAGAPAAQSVPGTTGSSATTTDESPEGDPRLLPVQRRVMIVDDHRDTADTLASMLELLGYDVRTAYDGGSAIAVAEQFRPDVMLMDIGMPRFNGFQVAQRIRAQPWAGQVVLIAVTAWDRDEDRKSSQDAGFDAHLCKPVDPEILFRLLRALNGLDDEVDEEGAAGPN